MEPGCGQTPGSPARPPSSLRGRRRNDSGDALDRCAGSLGTLLAGPLPRAARAGVPGTSTQRPPGREEAGTSQTYETRLVRGRTRAAAAESAVAVPLSGPGSHRRARLRGTHKVPPENRTREHSGLSSPGKHTTHLTCFMISNLFKPVRSQPVSLKHLSQTESRAKCPAAAEGDEPWPLLPAGASRDLPRARGDRAPPGAPGAPHSLSLPFSLFLSCCSFCSRCCCSSSCSWRCRSSFRWCSSSSCWCFMASSSCCCCGGGGGDRRQSPRDTAAPPPRAHAESTAPTPAERPRVNCREMHGKARAAAHAGDALQERGCEALRPLRRPPGTLSQGGTRVRPQARDSPETQRRACRTKPGKGPAGSQARTPRAKPGETGDEKR